MKFHYILTLLALVALNFAALSENIAYSYTDIIKVKSQLGYCCLKIELYDSDMDPKHLYVFRLVRSGTNDITPDKNLILQFASGDKFELTPLPGQMYKNIPYVWRGNNTTMPLRSMCYAMSEEVYQKLKSFPIDKIILESVNYGKGKQKIEEIKIKPKDATSLLEVLQNETELIEKRQADMIQNWGTSSTDFYEGF